MQHLRSIVAGTACLAIVSLCASTHAAAAEPRQPTVLVTATRTPVSADAALAHVSVITREDIEASATVDLVALLRRQAGIDIARGGGTGQQSSVFLRGSNSNHVLVLVDGVRVSSVNTGGYAWEHLPLEHIERIEIVRGPRAALYGSDAIGGVIQVFTRRPHGPEASVAAGNHDTTEIAAGIGAGGGHGRIGVRVSRLDSGGINAQRPDGFAFDPDDDGYDRRTLAMDASVGLGAQRVAVDGLATRASVEFDQGESELRNHGLAVALEGPLGAAGDGASWQHRLLLSGNRETLETPAFLERLDSRRRQVDWQHTLAVGSAELLFGASYLQERGTSTATFDGSRNFHQRRSNRAGFAAVRQQAGAHDLELALRHDRSSVFGGQTTGQAAWGVQLGDATRLHASHGRGFRAPTFNELFSPGFGGLFAGNPQLRPERSRSTEAGLRHRVGAGSLSAHAFRTDVHDLVDFTGEDFQAINVRRARIDGVELGAAFDAGAWRLEASATWQDPRDRDSGAALLRRPARKAAASLARRFAGGARLAIAGYAASSRPEFGGRLPGYGLLGISGSWPLRDGLALDAGIENLLDREYTLVDGFNTPGQTVLLRLRWEG